MPENFLTQIYFGRFNSAVFNQYSNLLLDEETQSAIDNYLKITRSEPDTPLAEKDQLSQSLIHKLKTINFFGLNIPKDYGGSGLRLRQYLKVVEVVATQNLSLGFTALAHLSIGVKGIVLFGTESQKQHYLPLAASGELIFSYALTEPKHGSDARHIETTARLSEDGRHYILNGKKAYITNANFAGAMTVFAQLDPQNPGFMGAFIVETSWQGVKIGKDIPKMGLETSSTATVHFDNVKVPVDNLLGKPGDGFKVAMTILNYGRLALGAASSGIMNQSLADMIHRSKVRTQFGEPIIQFELVQEMIVRAKVNRSVIAAITAFTAAMLEKEPHAPVAIESSHCKLFGTTRAWDTLYDALQVSGGAGYFSTQPYEKRMRDFRVTTIFEGTTEIHSIYPALLALRRLNRRMRKQAPTKANQLVFILKGIFNLGRWDLTFDQKEMRRALHTANRIARRIRWLLFGSLLIFGQSVIKRQFFLRRICTLSLYMYGILALLAKHQSLRQTGHGVDDDGAVLAYFTEEAHEQLTLNGRLFPTSKDKWHKRVMKTVTS